MVINEYLRYIKSKFNILLIIFMAVPVVIRYLASYRTKQEYVNTLISRAPDANIDYVKEIIGQMDGVYYFEEFIYSEFFTFFVILTLIGLGIHIGSTTRDNINSGYGSNLISRLGVVKYVKSILTAQIMYILSLAFGFLLILWIGTYLVGGAGLSQIYSQISFTGSQYIAAVSAHIIISLIYISLVMMVTSLSAIYVKNRYLLKAFPFILFFAPIILRGIILYFDLPTIPLKVVRSLDPETLFFSIFHNNIFDLALLDTAIQVLTLPVIFTLAGIVLYVQNTKRLRQDYLP